MFLYFSTFTGSGTFVDSFRPTAADEVQLEGGLWSCYDLRTDCTQQAGFSLVGSNIQLTTIPNGVDFLVDTVSGLDTVVPNPTLNKINNNLGSAIPNGSTWRQTFRAIATTEGKGKWGVVIGPAINFAVGQVDI